MYMELLVKGRVELTAHIFMRINQAQRKISDQFYIYHQKSKSPVEMAVSLIHTQLNKKIITSSFIVEKLIVSATARLSKPHIYCIIKKNKKENTHEKCSKKCYL